MITSIKLDSFPFRLSSIVKRPMSCLEQHAGFVRKRSGGNRWWLGRKRSGGNRWRLGRSVAAATDGGWGEA
ncbi:MULTISPECIES: hypothetical protein [Lysinibacillus]|uniref:hypothetical protein n=1 Tax=Lysinibacillus TaxID=400634 RepID=UPI001CBD6511|nr:hypothetical protein [Lysinibacillus sphaericus]